jgi:predicted  nucleic acid-binding Zn-ribbon protein
MLRRHLEENGYAGQVACFHGGGVDEHSAPILDDWIAKNPDAARGASRAANLRAALVEHFQDRARVLIATEAGAEGLNLQFCAMVVNYDLPWNPQRVEQRIGRCHRYGQRHDVVVVNFLEEENEAERRVLELLTDKFHLFDGVFGSSDPVLGALESGVGFERRIHHIFDTCRSPAQIEAAFAALRAELEQDIAERERKARKALLEHFDADVHERLRVQLDQARARMNRIEELFWGLTRWALAGRARFDDAALCFDLTDPPDGLASGRYELVRREGNRVAEAFVYRLTSPLGEQVLARGAATGTPQAHLAFDYAAYGRHLAAVEALQGRRGWLRLDRLRVTGFTDEEHLLFSGSVEGGGSLDAEAIERLFRLPASVHPSGGPPPAALAEAASHTRTVTTTEAAARNLRDFDAARERLYRWAEDQILAAEETVRELRRQERDLDRQARSAPTLEEKAALLKRLSEVEDRKVRARHALNTVEDDVRARRAALLDELERRVQQRAEVETVFSVSWEVA